MNPKLKNILGAGLIISAVILAYSAFIYAKYYSKSIEPSAFRSFYVSAEGKAVAIPDIAQFSFSVITQGGKDLAVLQKENTEKSNKIIEFLKSSGIEQKDIKTQNYNIEPRYQYFSCDSRVINSSLPRPCPPPEIVGYTINQSVSVKVMDFSKTGDIISGAVKNGANSVSQIQFTIDDKVVIENQARSEAIKKAKEKAAFVAKEGGFKLGRLLSIDEGFQHPIYPLKSTALGIGGGIAESLAPSPIIEPGTQEVLITITLRYEIE